MISNRTECTYNNFTLNTELGRAVDILEDRAATQGHLSRPEKEQAVRISKLKRKMSNPAGEIEKFQYRLGTNKIGSSFAEKRLAVLPVKLSTSNQGVLVAMR